MTASYGIDLSSNNHGSRRTFNFQEVKDAGYDYIINKCTEGRNYVNPYYNGPSGTDANDAAAAGLQTGAYHFAHPELNGPDTEAAWFLQHMGNPGTRWVDAERGLGLQPDQDLANWYVILMFNIDATGIYWNREYRDRLLPLMKPSDITNRLQWVAAPDVDEWPSGAWIWQCGQLAVPGIGVCDVNRSIVL